MILESYLNKADLTDLGRELSGPSSPFNTKDLLVEAYPLDFRIDALRSSLTILFDCRFCDGVEGNTAVLESQSAREFTWQTVPAAGPTQRTVVSWIPANSDFFSVTAKMGWIGTDAFFLAANSARFLSGNVNEGQGPPPNFVMDDLQTIRDGLPRWSSIFEPLAFATFGAS
jgi:hypothetical protein